MTDPTAWLDERQRLAAEATPGPWWVTTIPPCLLSVDSLDGAIGGTWDELVRRSSQDSHFIADARTSVPAMVAALRAVLEQHQALTEIFVDGHTFTSCLECGAPYPCATVRNITNALNGESHD